MDEMKEHMEAVMAHLSDDGFEQWCKEVDDYCWKHFGCGRDDLPDIDYYSLYEDGTHPAEVIHHLEDVVE